MFGDLGHATIVVVTAVAMILAERRMAKADLGEIIGTFFYGRYIILLMGLFSIFTGLIYNDVFSKGMHLFETGWAWPSHEPIGGGSVTATATGHTYVFGIDPTWHGAENSLVFINSYKMKMSIILGVIHMTFAICLQVPNHLFFNHPSGVWAEWIPQMIFLHSIFGYLVVMIIAKWSTNWAEVTGGKVPPNLLNMLIYMFLKPGIVEPKEQMYAGQGVVQQLLVYIALICIPWMLCVKPYLLWAEHNQAKKAGYQGVADADHARDEDVGLLEGEEEGEGHALREDMEEEHVSCSNCID